MHLRNTAFCKQARRHTHDRLDRRQAIQRLAITAWLGATASSGAQPRRPKLPVAGVVTQYSKHSHADVILGKILEGWRQDGGAGPDLTLTSLYTDQVPDNDLSRGLAREHDIPIASTIHEALTLGTGQLRVAGVLAIGEHGSYPLTKITKQKQYPRRRFFDAIVAAMADGGKFVPVFSDKHLGYAWEDAAHMVATARRHNIPLMAGSSLPVAWRYPAEEVPRGCQIEQALVVAYGGAESYGFHALEALQSVVERRAGGETGVAAVTALRGEQIWQAEGRGVWSRDLLAAAVGSFDGTWEPLEQRLHPRDGVFMIIEYRDGLTATVAMLNGVAHQFAVACQLRDEAAARAYWFRLEEQAPYGHFEHLLRGIEHLVHTREAPYPVERTLLTTGILDRAMHSLSREGARLTSPELDVRYKPSSWKFANADHENFPTPRAHPYRR